MSTCKELRSESNGDLLGAVNGTNISAGYTQELTSTPRSRCRRGSQATAKGEADDQRGLRGPIMSSFEAKGDERPPSGTSSTLPVSNCLICGDKATGMVALHYLYPLLEICT